MAKKLEKVTTLKTIEDVNNKLADLKIVTSRLAKTEAELNVKRTQLEQKYIPELTSLKEQKLMIETDVELWANEHKDELEKKRSWDCMHGSLGFRESTKLSTVKKFHWKDVLERMKNLGNKYALYIRVKEEVAKDDLKTDILSKALTLDEAARIGVCLETVDNFYIETNAADVQVTSINSMAG